MVSERPDSGKHLRQLIDREAYGRLGETKGKAMRRAFITAVVGQMLPEESFLKGGAAVALRYPLSEVRVSRDIDSVYTGSLDVFIAKFEENLAIGWEGFTGTVTRERDTEKTRSVNVCRLTVHLDYLGQRFASISFEASPDYGRHCASASPAMDDDTRSLLEGFGFDVRPTPMLDQDAQLADKLNGLSNLNYYRGKDLVDICTIMRHHVPDLTVLREQSDLMPGRPGGHSTRRLSDTESRGFRDSYSAAAGPLVRIRFDDAWSLADRLLVQVDRVYRDYWLDDPGLLLSYSIPEIREETRRAAAGRGVV
ncbi:nucleotidyl transferase AbiEii/AbiGii toxin family protein [uncultured Bifidobacterium sp.]|uniref:nucleotidyl transferase AbiEii/AbiGii toxin family protein n=1 Tax=uncultured Bifidobacterium sp. TaxID=165187 RepID=UPI002605F542|nr:nucleotidyl transferase AbiEii/AbiGii toxin family protein [uncultured Bifidobacterium sp.]